MTADERNERPREEHADGAIPPAVVMGVSGSGKTTVAVGIARRLGLPFADADDFHPAANVEKMRAGIPLTDEDRRPWLASVGVWLGSHADTGAVVACSALKAAYRDILRAAAPGTVFLHLDGPARIVSARVGERKGHYMPASLVASQYADLEPLGRDEAGLVLDFRLGVEELVEAGVDYLRERSGAGPRA